MLTIYKQIELADDIHETADFLADALDKFEQTWTALSGGDQRLYVGLDSGDDVVGDWEFLLDEASRYERDAIAYGKKLMKLVRRLTI